MQGGELLMVQRSPTLKAFPGYHAFPGGAVDASDSGQPHPHPLTRNTPPQLLHALLRELREELSLDLEAMLARQQVEAIHHLGVRTTPKGPLRRFNAHFFAIALNTRPQLTVDTGEIIRSEWATPQAWLQRYQNGDLLLAPPTIRIVRQLALDAGLSHENMRTLFGSPEHGKLSVAEPLQGVRVYFTPSRTIRPATQTNCLHLGDAPGRRLLVDPSPDSDEALEDLCAVIGERGFDEIFLTHHHPDHLERADVLARRAGVPLGMSSYTEQAIRRCYPGFLDQLQVRHYRDGDVVSTWLGQPVRALEVPGHDEGQLALMPEGRAWCMVGDLIQGVGTVVIPREEGNMRKYFASLQRIIDLDPRVIIPSHGTAMGSTHRLRETLKHRQLREQQIRALHLSGMDIDCMLQEIYGQLQDPALMPLARMNIEGHLQKLEQEGRLAPEAP